jgi:glycosyltransferase involved in cell wall biosynthesis
MKKKDKYQKKTILIVYHFIALYRKSVFEKLIQSDHYEVIFACDKVSKENIRVVDKDFFLNKQFVHLRNYWFKNFLWQKNLLKTIILGKYDACIFLADPNFLSTWLSIIICKVRGIKVIFWTHGFIRDNSFKSKIKKFYFKLADGLLLYGDNAKLNLVNKGLDKNKLFTIYNSLDYENQKKIRDSVSLKSFDKSIFFKNPFLKQIVFIGRLTPQKKLGNLIKLVVELEKYEIKVNLLFIGDGPQKDKLKALVDSSSLEGRVHFYGQTYSEEEIAPLIMSSDVCISPGEIGLTAMHILGYGVPVITHNDEFNQMPEYESVIDGYTGRLFKYNSFDSLLNVTIDFFKNPIPDVKHNCLSVIEANYTPATQKKLIEQAIETILGNKNL